MLGLTKREIRERFDEIVDFAELREFIDAPVKTYSSGMYMRLGFAVAIHVNPDVLLIDEVLAVGDEGFTHKCLDKFAEFRRRGKTILLVTHSLYLVERFCDEALWLDGGIARAHGDPETGRRRLSGEGRRGEEQELATTTARAVEAASRQEPGVPAPPVAQSVPDEASSGGESTVASEPTVHPAVPPADLFQATEGRWGSREVEITDVALLDGKGEAMFVFHSGEPLSIRLRVRANHPTDDFAFGVGLFNADGMCYGTNTFLEEMNPERLAGEAEAIFAIESLISSKAMHKLDVAVHKRDGLCA
jgi:energy-coupling factor transporter ATP-binding protein EcfA2